MSLLLLGWRWVQHARGVWASSHRKGGTLEVLQIIWAGKPESQKPAKYTTGVRWCNMLLEYSRRRLCRLLTSTLWANAASRFHRTPTAISMPRCEHKSLQSFRPSPAILHSSENTLQPTHPKALCSKFKTHHSPEVTTIARADAMASGTSCPRFSASKSLSQSDLY